MKQKYSPANYVKQLVINQSVFQSEKQLEVIQRTILPGTQQSQVLLKARERDQLITTSEQLKTEAKGKGCHALSKHAAPF